MLTVLMIVVLAIWVALATAAEIAHAWNSRTVRTFVNLYTIGYLLSVVSLVGRLVFRVETREDSVGPIVISYAVICLAVYMIGVHAQMRGGLLVCDLLRIGRQHPARIALEKKARKPLRSCLLMACLAGVVYAAAAGGYIFVWILVTFF